MKIRMVLGVVVIAFLFLTGQLYAAGDLNVSGNFNLLPAGTMAMYGGPTEPYGWLFADGRVVSRTTYANLFAAIGTTFGPGDGATTFNLPDFRGIFPKGAGTTNRPLGKDAAGNFYSGSLGQYAEDHLQAHEHKQYAGSNGAGAQSWSNGTNSWAPTVGILASGTSGTPRTGNTTEPQSLGVNFIIKY